MSEIGGWPLLGTNTGGNWDEASFDIVSLLVNLKKYNNAPVMSLYVSSDVKNSTQRILYVSMLLPIVSQFSYSLFGTLTVLLFYIQI